VSEPAIHAAGTLVTFSQATAALWVWAAAVLFHGLVFRSMLRPTPDPIRGSGPVD
jgi:hypothetical protein